MGSDYRLWVARDEEDAGGTLRVYAGTLEPQLATNSIWGADAGCTRLIAAGRSAAELCCVPALPDASWPVRCGECRRMWLTATNPRHMED